VVLLISNLDSKRRPKIIHFDITINTVLRLQDIEYVNQFVFYKND